MKPAWTRIARFAAAWACTCATLPVTAADVQTRPPGYEIQCFEDAATGNQYCFAPSRLTVKGRVRESPLFTGKGSDIKRTEWTAVAECGTSKIVVRDAKGSTPKNAPRIDPRVAEALARDMCTVANARLDKSLKP
jgi:hypothetical protein